MTGWPSSAAALVEAQRALARERPPAWRPSAGSRIGGCFVSFDEGGRAWAAAAVGGETAVVRGAAGAPYEAGLLALREGALLEAAVRALPEPPDALLVDATGRDHPRRAGLALQLGAVLGLPTVGVTHRPLLATGEQPGPERGARSPLVLDGEVVGCRLRTARGRRPLAVHAAWRTDADAAAACVLAAVARARTPEPLRLARRAARTARAEESPDRGSA